MKQYLFTSVEKDEPLAIFIPVCLRFYYDSNGNRQIIEHLNGFKYKNHQNQMINKNSNEIILSIEKISKIASALSFLGISTVINCIVMDNELKRFKGTDISPNFKKVNKYICNLKNKFGCEFLSALQTFGDPKESNDFKHITKQIVKNGGIPNTKITDTTFEHTINNRHSKFSKDTSLSKFYRSREATRISRTYALGEAYFHSRRMSELYNNGNISGYLLYVPEEADFDRQIYELVKETVTFNPKS